MSGSAWIGRSMERKEDDRLLVGEGGYVSDLMLPRMLAVAFVRSPHAHARIRAIDVEPALALEGVVAVRTGKDFAELGPILSDLSVPNLPGETKRPEFGPIPVDEVLYEGDLVAVVIARDRYIAEDGAEAVSVDYEPQPAVLDPEAALDPTLGLVYPDWGDNPSINSISRWATSTAPSPKPIAWCASVFEVIERERPRWNLGHL